MNRQIEQLKKDGFTGFVSVASLRNSCNTVPKVRGVYIVLRTSPDAPSFVEPGTGGFHKGRNPNVSVAELRDKQPVLSRQNYSALFVRHYCLGRATERQRVTVLNFYENIVVAVLRNNIYFTVTAVKIAFYYFVSALF